LSSRIYFIICIFISLFQQITAQSYELLSPANIRKFADHLYKQEDYLRSIEEYKKLENYLSSDTLLVRISFAEIKMGHYNEADKIISIMSKSLRYTGITDFLSLRNNFLRINHTKQSYNNEYKWDRTSVNMNLWSPDVQESFNRLDFFRELANFPRKDLLERINIFTPEERDTINTLLIMNLDPPLKSPLIAGGLSSIIPGLGKVYADRPEEGIISLILTATCVYISYTNFEAKHLFRGWFFGGLSAMFYVSNIYGTVKATEQYNLGVKIGINNIVETFLQARDYYSPTSLLEMVR